MDLMNEYIDQKQRCINKNNRERLTNKNPMLIASNCTGGFLYHWLGLRFRSPFINLHLTPEDFLVALENFDDFMNGPIEQIKDDSLHYPLGQGFQGVKVHFLHYSSFDEAISKWMDRKSRMDLSDKDSMGIIFPNWGGHDVEQLERFDALPFKHKVVFVDRPFPEIKSSFFIKGYRCDSGGNGDVYRTQYSNGERYIDQFDYVTFINSLEK